LGPRLLATLKEELELKIDRVVYWTDSITVLRWLRSEARRFKTFVALRVGEILETTELEQWKWVPTKENVADELTRDLDPADLSPNSRWINGPSFLVQPESEWPQEKKLELEHAQLDLPEMKKEFVGVIQTREEWSLPSVGRFSSWLKLMRCTAWMLRFVNGCRRNQSTDPELTPMEPKSAENMWIQKSQLESFGREVNLLENGKGISKKSKIFHLSPILENGILKVKGTIDQAEGIGLAMKRPIILDPNNLYTKLLADYWHKRGGHHGMERILNDIRTEFWILRMRAAVKASWNRCQFCKNRRANPRT